MGRSSFFATLARVMTSAAAPSDMDDALAAVIVPASAKAGFNKAIFSGLAFPGCSSVSTSISPPRPGTITGTIAIERRIVTRAGINVVADMSAIGFHHVAAQPHDHGKTAHELTHHARENLLMASMRAFKWMVHAPAPFLHGGKIDGEAGIRIFKTPIHITVWQSIFPVLVTIDVRFAEITVAWAIAVHLYCLRGHIIDRKSVV